MSRNIHCIYLYKRWGGGSKICMRDGEEGVKKKKRK